MGHEPQPNPGTPALPPQRQASIHETVARDQRDKEIAQERLGREFRPGDPAALVARFGAVASDAEAATVDAEGDAGEEVRCQWGEEEDGFEQLGLVVRPREEEVGVCGVEVARDEGEERGVGDVEGQEEGERVGGVFLQGEQGAG